MGKLMDYNVFLTLEDEEKKNILTAYRNELTNEEIVKGWGIGTATLYKFVRQLKLPSAPRTNKGKNNKKDAKKDTSKKIPVEAYILGEEQANVPALTSTTVEDSDGLGFKLKGKHTSERLIKRLEMLSLVLTSEEAEFEVDIRIKEVI